MIWGISASIAAAALLVYVLILRSKLKKLSNSFKELLQESRKQTPVDQRNKGEIYYSRESGVFELLSAKA